jgi:hypothetical protein
VIRGACHDAFTLLFRGAPLQDFRSLYIDFPSSRRAVYIILTCSSRDMTALCFFAATSFPPATITLLRMPQTEFQNGYIAGWQSIRADEQPPDFPVFQVQEGETPYRAGITLGVRDAVASIAKKTGNDRWMDDWFDNALRRR